MFSKSDRAPATVTDNAFFSVLTLCDVPSMATSDLSGLKTREICSNQSYTAVVQAASSRVAVVQLSLLTER